MTEASPLLSATEIQEANGLDPRIWFSVGAGFSREDLKTVLLSQGTGFVADAAISPQELAHKLIEATRGKSITCLGPLARQEVLRVLLAETRINEKMPELKRLRRQGNFYRRLDFTFQSARMAFTHWDEEAVFSQRLEALIGANPLRDEVRALAHAYEAWCDATENVDPPLLFREASELRAWPTNLKQPEKIIVFTAQTQESLERSFWESVSRFVSVEFRNPIVREISTEPVWELWHTLDDAADALGESLASDYPEAQPIFYNETAVLISDSSSARRSLKRALRDYAIPLADPRDPTRLRWDEAIKEALLPLEIVGRNFERSSVIAWSSRPEFVREINERGVTQGLHSYGGGKLVPLHLELTDLAKKLGGRKLVAEIATEHLRWLRRSKCEVWGPDFFENVWKEFATDLSRVGLADRKAPTRYWLERLTQRVSESPAPVERIKPEAGVLSYRLHQSAFLAPKHIVLFGIPANWLTSESLGDYWFSERERETLTGEFQVRSSIQIREERIRAVRSWVSQAEKISILNSDYDSSGRECQSIEPFLKEIFGKDFEPIKKGGHPRWRPSFGAVRSVPPQEVSISRIEGTPEIRASVLDRYSRCAFQSLALDRWKLSDSREPDTELWADVRGNILHRAVRNLTTLKFSPTDALDRAWEERAPRGLMRSERVRKYVRSRLLKILEVFCEKETEYLGRAKTHTIASDDQTLRTEYPDFVMIGQPDRIDENESGTFIIDYKTSSGSPNGTEMLELGYRLQLPAYALSVMKKLGKNVAGLQFVELNKKGTRSSGVFFKSFNGKEEGKFTNARSNSKSLLASNPDDVWARFEEHVLTHAKNYIAGKFSPEPKKEIECRSCMASDVCGLRRKGAEISDA